MEEKRINAKEQEELFSLIGRTLKKKTGCYVVGGTAMMFLNLKETTKDIDIVFKSKEAYENFRKTLFILGAKEPEKKVINPEKVSSIVTLGNARFDLFLEYLIHFKVTESIMSRIAQVHEFNNLIVNVIGPEEIILFKSFADRETDRVDVANILKKINVNWNIILKEAEEQTKNSEYFFVVFLYNFLEGIKDDFKINVPKDFMKELKILVEKSLLEAQRRLKEKV